MEAARRSDEWKILSKKIPATDAVPRLVASERLAGPQSTSRPRSGSSSRAANGHATIDEIARGLKKSSFDVAKTLFGLGDGSSRRGREAGGSGPAAATGRPSSRSFSRRHAERHDAHRGLQGDLEGRRAAEPPGPLPRR